ncbi:MAG: lactoylglutathione lyase [Phenylobacterium sp.]|uniref:VOC family protein n=1 Tax=Phenylobacterium sp. TaxID=1871053 RepID=UPI00273121DC|nr:lactoylglutathione lyase [Phenylobacterium sp.]MDP2010963.1 lactoylglutathione lyase [Phenylobacterium sp.]MDP3632915.1 lactoylglutathione lyase [Phenylobacterium sp.]
MTAAPKMIFVNLPVRDLAASTAFYEAIGCVKNEAFSNENAASMVWSETISFHLLTHDFYRTFTSQPIADAHKTSAALFCLSRNSRAEVDAIVEAAVRAGGQGDIREVQDLPFMYGRTFVDPDGAVFEPMWMDASAMPAG